MAYFVTFVVNFKRVTMDKENKNAELQKYYFRPKPFWESLPNQVCEEIQSKGVLYAFPKKTMIYSEGSLPKGLYIIQRGRAKVYVINNEGLEHIIYFLAKGEIFGYRPLVCEELSPVFIEAIEDCTVDCIPRQYFQKYLHECAELNAIILNYLGYEFRVFVNKLSVFAHKNVSERIPLALLVLHQKFNENDLFLKSLNFSRNDLAAYIGTAPETLIRQLKILKDNGLISTKGRSIVLEDMEGLWKRANL